jgi:hypothetical protein
MLHRFLTLAGVPELRSESASSENDVSPEVEVLLPVDKYWDCQEFIQEIRYLQKAGQSTLKLTQLLHKTVMPYVCHERERQVLMNIKAS